MLCPQHLVVRETPSVRLSVWLKALTCPSLPNGVTCPSHAKVSHLPVCTEGVSPAPPTPKARSHPPLPH